MFTIMTAVMFFKQGWKAALPAAIQMGFRRAPVIGMFKIRKFETHNQHNHQMASHWLSWLTGDVLR
jgi:hypothetical protein